MSVRQSVTMRRDRRAQREGPDKGDDSAPFLYRTANASAIAENVCAAMGVEHGVERCSCGLRSQTWPDWRTPLIKSPDSVKKTAWRGRGRASAAAVFQSAYIRRRFQMMTEIKHTLRSGRSVGRTVGRGRLYVGTVENCSFLGPSQPPPPRSTN